MTVGTRSDTVVDRVCETQVPNAFIECRQRVRYAETDQMGVAYHSHYLVWFEVGRSEFCRRHGFSYQEMEHRADRLLVVAQVSCRYLIPLRYDCEFLIRTMLQELKRRTLTFRYELMDPDGHILHAEGETIHVVTDREGRPRSLPEKYRKLLSVPDLAGSLEGL